MTADSNAPDIAARGDEPNMREIAEFLWSLLDDIDTASDRAKSDDKVYRFIVERIQRQRFKVGSTDGYVVTFLKAREA